MGFKKWKLPQTAPEKVENLISQTGMERIAAQILDGRGISDPQQAMQYIGCDSAARLHDPFLMQDMDKAVERLSEAVEQGEQIAVYGDYDCDGITATAMLYSYLEDLGARVIYYIPDRDVEGYGLNRAALDFLKEQQVELIVTVDNGISALDEAVYAKELGIDLIITDHHQPRPQLPQACAVIDPHRQDCEYPFKALCGAGVAFKLICAMEGDLGGEEMIWHFGELAAIATMADVVELTGENRLIVQRGLECIAQGEQVGVHALIEAAGMSGRKLDSIDLAFGLAPRINAAGRLGQTDLAMELLLCDRQSQAMELAQQLNELNEQRKALVDHIYEEINAKIARHPEILQERVILLYGEGWHHGVIGIAAARLVEEYSKPCVLFSIEEDQARGSARSVEGYSIIAAISRCSSLLTRYGGHDQAAGMTVPVEHLREFIDQMLQDAREHFDLMPVDQLKIDAVVDAEQLNLKTVYGMQQLRPFGCGNEQPVVAMPGCRIEAICPLSENRHLRLKLSYQGKSFSAIYFRMSPDRFPFYIGDTVDVAANLDVNEYNGEKSVSVKIKDVRLHGVKQDKLVVGRQYYEKYCRHEPLEEKIREYICPQREDVAGLYRFLRQCGGFAFGYDMLWCRLRGINYCKMRICIDVMQELGLIERARLSSSGEVALRLPDKVVKTQLDQSRILRQLKVGE